MSFFMGDEDQTRKMVRKLSFGKKSTSSALINRRARSNSPASIIIPMFARMAHWPAARG